MIKPTLAVLFFVLLAGCTDQFDGIDLDSTTEQNVRAEYAPSHPWIGQCAKFESPMVYITNLPPDYEHAETMRIGRKLSRAVDANYLRTLPDGKELILTPVPPDTTFEVTAVFTYVHTGFSSMFTSDTEIAVLMDNHNQRSTVILDALETCN
jgi:hypothetical protein